MNKLDKIRFEKIDKINFKKLNYSQRQDYYSLVNRIEWLLTLEYFLFLREKIKKQVSENYRNKSIEQISSSIVVYDASGFIDYKNYDLYNLALQLLIEQYVKQQFTQIENSTLKLEL